VTPRVTVIDYGVGNLLNVVRACEHLGAEVRLTAAPDEVAAAERLILPGVGAFAEGMEGLRRRGLVTPLVAHAAAGRPLFGICLGLQLLFDESHEFGRHAGLGILKGAVVELPRRDAAGGPLRVPNIGWSAVTPPDGRDWRASALADVAPGTAVYFVHSFHVRPADDAEVLAVADFGGHPVVAAVGRGAVSGCQFHPEKSGPAGLSILKRFLAG
jgi:glutamine amidotransferase